MSVPQIVVVVILMTASPACGLGRDTSSTATRSLPLNTTAFIVCMSITGASCAPIGTANILLQTNSAEVLAGCVTVPVGALPGCRRFRRRELAGLNETPEETG